MMRTDDLMRSLVADATPAPRLEPLLRIALVASLAVSAVLFAALLGPRPDLAAAATDPRFMFKFVVTLVLAGTGIAVALRLARPGLRARVPALLLAPGLLVAAVLAELAVTPAASWSARLVGSNALVCLVSVPLLAAPVLVAVLTVLRRGAPLRPALTGAVAGLVAGGLGATLYASHCVDDSPLFVATWYSLAIALVVAAGALAGARLLRW